VYWCAVRAALGNGANNQKKHPKKIRSTTNATLKMPYMISENSKDRRKLNTINFNG
jgi:hypothetical protein